MDILSTYNLIIEASTILILSFFFGELSRKTNIPSVLMLIVLGIVLKFGIDSLGIKGLDFLPILQVLGTVGLIMIVLEAALELELKQEKLLPIMKALVIAILGLMLSAWITAMILHEFVDGMTMQKAWIYATPLSILSSAIIIPSVKSLQKDKKEFHIYESTFSDIVGIIVFYFLIGPFESVGQGDGGHSDGGHGLVAYGGTILLTIVLSLIVSYIIVLVFQNIKTHTKLFLLIAVLLLLYALGKQWHLSSLIIILIFGLVIANMPLFFQGIMKQFWKPDKSKELYEGLHVITMETAFVVRTFFFVIFGLTISLASLVNLQVAIVSGLIIVSIYFIRYIILRIFIGKDILPQLFIAPRGLITVLLFYAIPASAEVEGFEPGILLFIIIGTSLIMTFALIFDKQRASRAIRDAESSPIGYEKWKAPQIEDVTDKH
jgi:NhaP-type Na+/H+ or K+/H+ antiporter